MCVRMVFVLCVCVLGQHISMCADGVSYDYAFVCVFHMLGGLVVQQVYWEYSL